MTYLTRDGYVRVMSAGREMLEHVLIAEDAIGRPLPARAEVHHVNGIRSDNDRTNLVVCEDRTYHYLLHVRQAALDACGHADWRKCGYCHRHDDPARMVKHSKGRRMPQVCHKECRSEYGRARRHARRAA